MYFGTHQETYPAEKILVINPIRAAADPTEFVKGWRASAFAWGKTHPIPKP